MAEDSAAAIHRPLCPDASTGDTLQGGDAICTPAKRPFVLAATILASAMAFIDGSVVMIALPTMQANLAASFGAMQWVVNGYALALGALILVGGAAGDRFGRKRIFLLGIAMFALASIACAVAPSVETLVAARVWQGVGAALLVPQSLAIIAASFPRAERGGAIGTWAAVSAVTTSLGPPLGGWLVDFFDWRMIFWINIPLASMAFVLALRYIRESRSDDCGPVDWAGAALAISGFGLLAAGLTAASGEANIGSPWLLGPAGVVVMAMFIWRESRAPSPLLPLGLFHNRAFVVTNVLTLFLYGALSGVLFLVPFDLISNRGVSSSEVGLVLAPLGIIIGILSTPAGKMASRIGVRFFLAIGSLAVGVAALWLAAQLPGIWLGAVVPIVLLSLGMSLVVAPLTAAVMDSVADRESGIASGVNNAASRLAALFSVAIVGSIASLAYAYAMDAQAITDTTARFGSLDRTQATRETQAAFAYAYRLAIGATAVAALIAAAIAAIALPGRIGIEET